MEARVWHQHYDPNVPVSMDYPSQPVDHLADRFAAGLQGMGLQKGERVVLYMPNCPQFVIAYYGTLRAGGVVVPSNPLYVAREIEHQIKDAGATFAVVLSLMYPNIKQVRAHTSLRQVIVTNIKEYFPGLLKALFTLAKEKKEGHRVDISNDANTTWFQNVLAEAPAAIQPVETQPQDVAVLMYTGGTTGVPKGAQLTHRNLVANALQASAWLSGAGQSEEAEVMLTALPLTHSYSMTVCMNLSVFGGHTQVIIPNPRDLIHVLNAINIHRPSYLPGVPALYTAINNHPDVKSGKYNLKSIKACLSGAAGLPVEVQSQFQRITGGRLVEGFGLSETSPVALANPLGSGGRIGTIGLPVSDTDVKLMDPDTEETEVGPNQPGVVCIRGPQVMKGYWNMAKETAESLRQHPDGQTWLHTGDIAEMSEDGYFRIVDRKKDMILASGGFNVYPRDIEERLYEHPKVLEAVAIGVPVGGDNQRAKAFVVLKPDQTASPEEIIAWCKEGLAPYKVPKFVEFRSELPKTMVGKILRRQLMEEEVQREKATAQNGS